MELAGIMLDVHALGAFSAELGTTLDRLVSEIYELAGCEFNIDSPPQLRTILFERLQISPRGVRRGKTGLSTDVDVLTRLAEQHPLPAKLLELPRALEAQVDLRRRAPGSRRPGDRAPAHFVQPDRGGYRALVELRSEPAEHPHSHRRGAAHPRGVRRRARASVLISADYSQIELRVLAHLSNDPALIAAFEGGEDVHARTAREVFADRPRRRGAAPRQGDQLRHRLRHGSGARGARARGLPAAAAEYITAYFQRYPGVRSFVETTIAEARSRGYVTTVLGRRRYLPELSSRDHAVRQFAERAATNTPIQGSAADLIKLAMLEVRRRLAAEAAGARMLLQVHDELLLEVPDGQVERVSATVRDAMENVSPLRVPLRVDVRHGANWAEAH